MYGLVNQGIKQMVTETFGPEAWVKIHQKAEVQDVYVAMEPYPDSITIQLVGAASEVLEMAPAEVLRAFGKWWISFAQREYEGLFQITGKSFTEFVTNLNDIHTRVGYMLTRLSPPSFKIVKKSESLVMLHYYSQREGLYPMVLGMIEGIADNFDTKIQVEHTESTAEGADHDVFTVELM